MTATVGTTAIVDERSMTIDEFCALEQMSRATYFKFQRNGLGPVELRAPGGSFVRITQQSRREWHARMIEVQRTERAETERVRRVEMCRAAGARAAKSVRHVSKTRKRARA